MLKFKWMYNGLVVSGEDKLLLKQGTIISEYSMSGIENN